MKIFNIALPLGCILFAAAAPVMADTISFDTNTDQGGATGSYHVVLQSSNDVDWSVAVTGNNNGNGSPSAPLATPAKHTVDQVSITFFGDSHFVTPITLSAGGTFTGSNTASALHPDTDQWNQPVHGVDTATWQINNALEGLDPYGTNTFNGSWDLSKDDVKSVRVSLQDGGQQWTNDFVITPEGSSLALLLPALLPIGIALRRRRTNRS